MLSAFLLFSGIFGCSGNNEYTVDDIVFIHAAYYAAESNPVYSFALRKEKACWLFSADCRVGNQKERYVSFSSFPIPSEEANEFLAIIRDEGEIKRLRKHRNPIRIFQIPDAPMRSFGMTFSDGTEVNKETAIGNKALDYLFTLADRHCEAAENVEVTAVFIRSSSMNYSSSYSFTLEKNGISWYLSFDAVIDGSGTHTEAEKQPVDECDAEEILRIVKQQQLVTMVRQYKKPPDDGIFALDETAYRISFDFADGSSICAPVYAGDELINAFRCLTKAKIRQQY